MVKQRGGFKERRDKPVTTVVDGIEVLFPVSTFIGENGKKRTRSLFLERGLTDVGEPVYTLAEYDRDGCISFKRVYRHILQVCHPI